MHKLNLAQWILSLSTDPARAAAIVGDLAELEPARGALWFWCCIARTAARQVPRSFVEAPARIAGLSFAAVLIDLTAALAFAFVDGLVFFAVAFFGGSHALTSIAVHLFVSAQTLLIALLLGRLLARWLPGRELAACFAYLLFAPACDFIINFQSHASASFLLSICLTDLALRSPVLAGAIWGRTRRLRVA